MSQTSPVNRRLSTLIALLYVFFSTFGALTHSDAPQMRGASRSAHDSHTVAFTSDLNNSAPAHCPICDWQSLQVVPTASAPQIVKPILLRMASPTVAFRLPSLPGFRSSSRGPPLA